MFILGTYARYLNHNCSFYKDIDVYGTKETLDELLKNENLYVNPTVFENHYMILTKGLKDKAIEFSVVPQGLLDSVTRLELEEIVLKGVKCYYANDKTDQLIMWAIRSWNVKDKHKDKIKRPSSPHSLEELKFYQQYRKYLVSLYGAPNKRKPKYECE